MDFAPANNSPAAHRLRRLAWRAHLAVVVVLAILLFGMVNYLSMRHYARVHWQRDPQAGLSKQSRRVLAQVVDDIRILAVIRPAHPAYRNLFSLLQEYAAQAPNLSVEWIDPDRDMARTEQVARQYRLGPAEAVVVATGGRSHIVPADDLIELREAPVAGGDLRRIFRGEGQLSGAVFALTQATRPVVHFLQGHGERSPLDFNRHTGYSRIAGRLRDENLDVEVLNLGAAKSVPNHCALMIIAGPVRPFAPFEIALIRDYLNRKGRLLLLLDARVQTGLEPLLAEWGVLLGGDVVVDESRTLSGRELYISTYPEHPITAPLQDLASVLFLPRSIRAGPYTAGGDKPALLPLATCTTAGWAEFDPDDAAQQFDPPVDIPGPVPVAMAIERGPVAGVHVQIRPTRLVVIGDSDFAANGGLTGANADLFLNSAHWLLDREEVLEVADRILDDARLAMDARQLHRLFAGVVAGLPALVAALGLGVAWIRRRA